MKPGEKADAKQETTAPEGEKEVKETEPVKAEEGQEQFGYCLFTVDGFIRFGCVPADHSSSNQCLG